MNGRLYDPVLGRMLSPDPFTQNFNRYSYVLNNPLRFTDPSGEFIQYIVGGIFGGLAGNSIAKAKGATGLAKFGYILGGVAIGAVSGGISAHIAAGGGFMANTASIVAGTFTNSVGMHALSGGMTDINIGFGAFSYNVSQNSFGFIGKPENSTMQNIGYFFGTFANVSDLIAWNKGTDIDIYTNTDGIKPCGDKYGHSAAVGEDINISVGQGDIIKNPGNWFKNSFSTKYAKTGWDTYANSDDAISIAVTNVNKTWLQKMNNNLKTKLDPELVHTYSPGGTVIFTKELTRYQNLLGTGIAKYNILGNSCSSYVSRALWYSGVPNIGMSPIFLHASLAFRQSVIYNHSFYIGF